MEYREQVELELACSRVLTTVVSVEENLAEVLAAGASRERVLEQPRRLGRHLLFDIDLQTDCWRQGLSHEQYVFVVPHILVEEYVE